MVSITTVAALHTGPANFWADFEQRIIDRAKVSSKTIVGLCQGRKTALRTLVVTFEVSTLHTVPIETQLLSVQCYAMHGQNINLGVCVCVWVRVCVSVTLSVNSPTGQTPQRILTVDSLEDADLRKDVPFGGLDDE